MNNSSSNSSLRNIFYTLNPWYATDLLARLDTVSSTSASAQARRVVMKQPSKPIKQVPPPLLVGVELNPGPVPRSNSNSNSKSQRRKSQRRRRANNISNGSIGSQQYLMESNISRFPRPTICRIGSNSAPFPDELYNTMKCDVNFTHSGAAQQAATYSINGPSYLFGPQSDWAGAFSANYPAGIDWLLGTTNITGSSAPYKYSTVYYYRFEFEFINSTAAAIDIIIFPSINPSYIGMAKSNLAEQRGAIKMVVPASSIAGPYRCRFSGKVNELFGVTEHELLNDTDYVQIVGSAPTRQCFMHCVVGSKDGSTSISLASTLTAYFGIKFNGINPIGTAGPT